MYAIDIKRRRKQFHVDNNKWELKFNTLQFYSSTKMLCGVRGLFSNFELKLNIFFIYISQLLSKIMKYFLFEN